MCQFNSDVPALSSFAFSVKHHPKAFPSQSYGYTELDSTIGEGFADLVEDMRHITNAMVNENQALNCPRYYGMIPVHSFALF
jgi:hypothetical protein